MSKKRKATDQKNYCQNSAVDNFMKKVNGRSFQLKRQNIQQKGIRRKQ